jgi:hypothetical protein
LPDRPKPCLLLACTGCYYWDYQASAGVRTAITIARIGNRDVALFGDRRGHAYSVDAATGETVWKVTVVEGPHLGITGAPTLFEGAHDRDRPFIWIATFEKHTVPPTLLIRVAMATAAFTTLPGRLELRRLAAYRRPLARQPSRR